MEQPCNEQTPKKRGLAETSTKKTPTSTPKNFAKFLLISNNQSFTPSPSSLSQRVVRNPFENHLYERLHLPVISSPSLFQTTLATPKRSFEWTIDELSSFNPANLIPHETQFFEDVDPVREAQAQAAINSFFTEQIIVPSPQDCALRSQKIFLKEDFLSQKIANSTAMGSCRRGQLNEGLIKQSRDAVTQTAISLPPILPREVEDMLKRYQLINNDNDLSRSNVEDEALDSSLSNRSMMDVSTLRRKLFINRPQTPTDNNELFNSCNVELSPAPRTPQLVRNSSELKHISLSAGNDSFSTDMFGELSPIKACTPIMTSSQDVSMMSENGHEKTPSRGNVRGKLRKGKNLSESFCMLQDEFKENIEDLLPGTTKVTPKRFGRFDSGFSADEDSKFSTEFSMQF